MSFVFYINFNVIRVLVSEDDIMIMINNYGIYIL